MSNIIVVHGEDDYLRERAVEQIRNSLKIEFPEFNVAELVGALMEETLNSAVVLPFMSGTRLVVANGYASPQGHEQKEREKIKKYAVNPVYSTVLVFSVKTLPSVLADISTADYIDCKKLDQNALEKWITVYCRNNGKSITPYNARIIADYCLNDMARISTEVKKICFYSDDEITKDDIDLMIEKDSEIKLYELANEIANKNADKAFLMAKNLLIKGTTVSALVSSVYRTFRRMFYSVVSGLSQKEMASCLGVQPFAVAKAREVAEKFSQVKLKRALEICAAADEDVKSNINGNAVVNYLILSLIGL